MAAPVSFDGDDAFMEEDNMGNDPELEAIKARVLAMEAESAKLKEMQFEVDSQILNDGGLKKAYSSSTSSSQFDLDLSCEDKLEVDARSVYVGNVDYGATAEELERHFNTCGIVNRVTILCNKFDGNPKGFAYIEFLDTDSVISALALDDSLFRGRQIKVMPKRTNQPGFSTTNRAPWARGYRGRSSYRGRVGFGAIHRPRFRGRTSYLSPY